MFLDTKIRHQAPLDKEALTVRSTDRDSGILVPDREDTSDLVPVHVVPVVPHPPAYDQVPPPRPTKTTADNKHDNDVPPKHFQGISPQKLPLDNLTSCPVDLSSCSESSLSSINTDSSSDLRARPSSNSNYDYPPQSNYDVPKVNASHYDTPKRSSCGSENGNELYDYPPQQTYDVVPPPVCAPFSSTMPIQRGLTRVLYQDNGQYSGNSQEFSGEIRHVRPVEDSWQYGNYNNLSSNIRPAQQCAEYSTLPENHGKTMQVIYDHVPSRFEDPPTYDTVPRPKSLPSGYTSANYDYVPPPLPAHSDNFDGQEGHRGTPSVPRQATPVQPMKTYVNLTISSDEMEYKKPLPSTPEMQQDSGTDHDVDEDVYDVPPVHPGKLPSLIL